MRACVSALAVLLSIFSQASAQPVSPVVNSSRIVGGERVLEQSVVVATDIGEAWRAFATAEGFRAWAAPTARIDLRVGGLIESLYEIDGGLDDPRAIRNEITALAPERMLAFRNVAPAANPAFDAATFQGIQTIVSFERIDAERTKVTIMQPGYGAGPLYDGVYRFFEWGNRVSLEQLRRRFESGPIDWSAALKRLRPPDGGES
jgi:uncharacterized protein YndB with AHSA1/START domain